MLFSALYDAVLCDHSTRAGYSTVLQEVVFFLIVYREEDTFFFNLHIGSEIIVITQLYLHRNICVGEQTKMCSFQASIYKMSVTAFFLLVLNFVIFASHVTAIIIHS